MLKPYEMSSVIITCSNNMQETVIKELHNLKVLHIVEHSKNELADIGKPLESANKLSEVLVKVRALIAALNIKKEEVKFQFKNGLSEIELTAKKLNEEVTTLFEQLKTTEELILKNQAIKNELEILKNFDIPLDVFTTYKTLIFFTGYLKNKDKVLVLKEELSKITEKFMLFDSFAKKRCFIVLFIEAKNKDKISIILQKLGFSSITLTNIANFKGTASINLKKIEVEKKKIEKIRDEIKEQIVKIAKEFKEFLIAADKLLSEHLEKAEAPLKFASTQSSFLIKGWIPTVELKKSIDRLNKVTNNKIFLHFESARKEDKVPVKLKNPKLAKPFEFLLDLYSTPTYKEIDPTFFLFLTFPIFFGIMLGDIGYGFTSLVVFWLLKKKMPKINNFLNILMLASFASIIFGFLFGEFFGYEFMQPAVSREHEIFKLLYIAIAIGVVHVNIGLIIGFINELKSHGLMHAIYAKASWITLEIGFALLVLSALGKILIAPWIGATFLGSSILMLIKSEGFRGIIEIPTIFANIVSYMRLAAIGLTSVILALIINESATEFFHKGGFFVLAGILILIIGHIINILIGWLGSFLHSLRLHYVEFFSKFFQGGAKKYQPFGLKEE